MSDPSLAPVIHEDGVYFGMDEGEYRLDPALGSTDHKGLLISPVQWWASSAHNTLNAALELEADSDNAKAAGKRFGSACHVVVLEGRDAFETRYFEPQEPPHDLLTSKDDYWRALAPYWGTRLLPSHHEQGIEPIGKKPPQNIGLPELRKAATLVPALAGRIDTEWAAVQAELAEDRETISRKWAATLRLIGYLMDVPRASRGGRSIRDEVLTKGAAEVSVFWTDERGIRCKARLDYLRIKTVIDLKTFAAQEGREVIDAFCWAVHRYAYDMQAAHYLEARARLAELVAAGKVHGEHDPAWLAKVAAYPAEKVKWTWLTVQTVGMPEIDTCELAAETVLGSARYMVQQARDEFLKYRDKHGMDEPWVADRGRILLEDATFPPMITSRGAQRWQPI